MYATILVLLGDMYSALFPQRDDNTLRPLVEYIISCRLGLVHIIDMITLGQMCRLDCVDTDYGRCRVQLCGNGFHWDRGRIQHGDTLKLLDGSQYRLLICFELTEQHLGFPKKFLRALNILGCQLTVSTIDHHDRLPRIIIYIDMGYASRIASHSFQEFRINAHLPQIFVVLPAQFIVTHFADQSAVSSQSIGGYTLISRLATIAFLPIHSETIFAWFGYFIDVSEFGQEQVECVLSPRSTLLVFTHVVYSTFNAPKTII